MGDQDLRLLCLDGGGVRGLSSLYILKQLMETVNLDHPPKPCNFFHMIGGTSTGGLIAIMLGRLRMDVDRCIDMYIAMMDKVFKKNHLPINIRGNVQARFDTVELERAIKQVITDSGLPVDATMRNQDPDPNECKVFVCANSSEHRELGVQFSSYRRSLEADSELFNTVKIWEACRATSAATTFFSPIKIGRNHQEFLDGATGANNPSEKLWSEAKLVWGRSFESRIQCLVSIGTGMPGVAPFGGDPLSIGRTFVAIATETERTANKFRDDHEELDDRNAFYRFNVNRGLENIGLEEAQSRDKIATMTHAYMAGGETRRLLRQFRDTNTKFGGVLDFPDLIPPPSKASAFMTLDDSRKFVKPNTDSYWERLTIDALKVYESIYEAASDPKTGLVNFESFFQLFNDTRARPEMIARIWQRIDGPRTSLLPKNLVLAILYMLHVESFTPDREPKPISINRRKILECYGNWVTCACGCGRKWNFAGGFEGLRRDGNKRKECLPAKWKDAGPLRRRIMGIGQEAKIGAELYDKNRTSWLRHRELAQPA